MNPLSIFTIRYKVAVYAPTERADTLPVFHSSLPYMYSVAETYYPSSNMIKMSLSSFNCQPSHKIKNGACAIGFDFHTPRARNRLKNV
jgi:hypothetical protein